MRSVCFVAALLLVAPGVSAQRSLSDLQRARIDSAASTVLTSTGAPGASLAVVWDGRIAYEHAYGSARIDPPTPTTPAMRFSIGSVSKQFTATAVLLLAEQNQLSLDDKVAKWLPDLTRAGEISIRQLLSMTAGYQDFWPQDYVFQAMLQPITPEGITAQWAKKPLDFPPGTQWQYSNTNYVIAGMIVEKVSGMKLFDFLRQRIFSPLHLTSVRDINTGPLGPQDAAGYLRNAVGPLRPAPKEANGWLFGAGQLAMTAHDLALWDISVIDQTVLRPASYRTQQTDARLESGQATGYGLGVTVSGREGRRRIAHGGAVSGYLTTNEIYPDHHAAIVVLSNAYPGAAGPSAEIATRIGSIIFEVSDSAAAPALEQARRIFADFQQGRIDRTLFSPNANAFFTDQVVADFASSLGPLGAPSEFRQVNQNLRGGMTFRAFRIRCGGRTLELTTRMLPEGKLEQYLIDRVE